MGIEIGGIIEEMHEDEEGRRIIDKVKVTHLSLIPDEDAEDDYIVRMPPLSTYPIRVKIKSVEKGVPRFVGLEDEVKDAMEICGCGLAKEMCCWDEFGDEALAEFERLIDQSTPFLDESALAYVRSERAWSYGLETLEPKTPLVDYNYPTHDKPPARTFLDKLRFWTYF